MSITAPNTLDNYRESIAGEIKFGLRNTLATIRATPADKLDHKPSDTAKSVRELGQHALGGNNLCLNVLGSDVSANPEVTEADQILTGLEKTGTALADLAEKADAEELQRSVEFFGKPYSVADVLLKAAWHMSRHAAQIDYLQTTWGDLEDH